MVLYSDSVNIYMLVGVIVFPLLTVTSWLLVRVARNKHLSAHYGWLVPQSTSTTINTVAFSLMVVEQLFLPTNYVLPGVSCLLCVVSSAFTVTSIFRLWKLIVNLPPDASSHTPGDDSTPNPGSWPPPPSGSR